ncbi:uncharacterized protein PgNI_04451 [Pyricularia grisea]|uniref:Uncharacterized protein n=1 Tax=Pyricularia grisea TaxID=148305 RepID=A0A6P8BEI1_PYRGI|nr:uncharacterized protein PgNI_04451 [Pyricularia grisea]TLD14107.1 hypothetical protein PgNI_04451 [Pyricularia grisea]
MGFLDSPCSARALAARSHAPSRRTSWSSAATIDPDPIALPPFNVKEIKASDQQWPPGANRNQNKTAAGGYFESCINCKLFGKYENSIPKDGGSLFRCECDYPGRPGGFRRKESVLNLNNCGQPQVYLVEASPAHAVATFSGAATSRVGVMMRLPEPRWWI